MRRPFAPAPDIVSTAWDWVTGNIVGAERELRQAKASFEKIMAEGDVFRGFDRDLSAALADKDWHWPWLEEWRAKFCQMGMVPYMWRRELAGTGNWAEASYPAAGQPTSSLISHSASMATSTLGTVAQGLEPYGMSERRLRLSTIDDEAEAAVAALFATQSYLDPHGDLPPFFPGDRTGVMWVTKRSAERYGWAW
jgi:hypothetical protein